MSWLAFLGVLLSVSLINQEYWLTIQQSECLLNDAALCNLLFAYSVTTLVWLGITIFLLIVEVTITWLIHHWHDEDLTNAGLESVMRHPALRFFMWIENTTIWPTSPRLSRNLVFWLATGGLFSYSFAMAYGMLVQYVIITVTWTFTLFIASVFTEQARRTILTYSSRKFFKQAIAISRMLFGLLLSMIKWLWVRLFPKREMIEPRILSRQPSDEAALRFLWRLALYFAPAIFTAIQLEQAPASAAYIQWVQLGLFVVLARAQFTGGWRPMLVGLYGLFTIDQYLMRIVPGNSMPRLPLGAHELAMFLVFVLVAWNSHQWEQIVRYRIALQAEQLRLKKSHQMQLH